MEIDTRIEYEYSLMMEHIEKEMHNTRDLALRKVSSVIAHFTSDIALMLAYSWFDSLPSAERIANELDLGKLDFLAIQQDFEGFKEEYLSQDFCEVMDQYAI